MYVYDEYDQQMVDERVAQYRDQTTRFLAGELPEDEFQQLRLRNGLYIQRLAPMLRIAVPYGMMSSRQLRKIADITRKYDKSYCHFTTRQNVQLNWPKLEEVPDILEELATVEMHAIQTSGSCIRNVTSDQFAGVARDEIEDPLPNSTGCHASSRLLSLAPNVTGLLSRLTTSVSGCSTATMRSASKYWWEAALAERRSWRQSSAKNSNRNTC